MKTKSEMNSQFRSHNLKTWVRLEKKKHTIFFLAKYCLEAQAESSRAYFKGTIFRKPFQKHLFPSTERQSRKPVVPPSSEYHTFPDGLPGCEAFRSVSTLKTHSRTEGGGERGEEIRWKLKTLGKAPTTWEPSVPFHQAEEEGQKRVLSPKGGGGDRDWKSP